MTEDIWQWIAIAGLGTAIVVICVYLSPSPLDHSNNEDWEGDYDDD